MDARQASGSELLQSMYRLVVSGLRETKSQFILKAADSPVGQMHVILRLANRMDSIRLVPFLIDGAERNASRRVSSAYARGLYIVRARSLTY